MRNEALARPRSRSWSLGGVAIVSVAAMVLVALSVALTWEHMKMPPTAERSAAPLDMARVSASPGTGIYESRKGQQRAIALADGSTLTLNTASRAEVSLTAERREVRLLHGQASFRVAPDRNRPFSVIAGSLDVRALGTQFDVRLEQARTEVVLIEGKVQVDPMMHRGIARLLPALDRYYLKPGQRLISAPRAGISVEAADLEQSTSWHEGRLVFRGEPLGFAVAEFNRYNARQLAIDDPALAQLTVSGVFSTTRPENFVIAVAGLYPVQVEERSPQLTLLRFKKK
jgi:transmembrane sensor